MPPFRRGSSKAPAPGDPGGGVGTLTAPGPDGPPPAGGRSRRRYDPAWDEWQRPRRWPGILLSCAIVLGFLGVVVWHYRPHPKAPVAAPTYTPRQLKGLRPTFVVGASGRGVDVTTYRGTKNKLGLAFTTNGQLLVLHAKCTCVYNFVVTISDAGGVPESFPVSNTGTSNVTLNQTLDPGRYVMRVIASGPWEVQLIQPTAATPLLPTTPRPSSTSRRAPRSSARSPRRTGTSSCSTCRGPPGRSTCTCSTPVASASTLPSRHSASRSRRA